MRSPPAALGRSRAARRWIGTRTSRRLSGVGRIALALGLLLACGGATVGCALSPQNVAAGGRCLRSTQCNPGLVCAGGVCTADLDGFGGTVPVIDAGPIDAPIVMMDVPMDDVGPVDSGPLPDVGPGLDAPVIGMDSGPGMDAGPPPVDAPPPTPDTPAAPDVPDEPDAPPPEIDAGEPDAPP